MKGQRRMDAVEHERACGADEMRRHIDSHEERSMHRCTRARRVALSIGRSHHLSARDLTGNVRLFEGATDRRS